MIPTHGIPVSPRSRDDIQSLTNLIRSELDIKDFYFPITQFLEFGMPILFEDFSYEILSLSEMGDNHGATFPEKNLIQIREDVYEGALSGKGRDRFTIAHELGHFFLHSEIPLHARKFSSQRPRKTYCDSEWQADCFAGELLVPVSLSHRNLSEFELSDLCGVSLDAASCQLRSWSKKRKGPFSGPLG